MKPNPLPRPNLLARSASIVFDDVGATIDARLRLSGSVAPFDYYVSGSLVEEDGWRDEAAVRLGKIFAKLGWTHGDTDLTVSFQRAENRIEQPGSLPLSELRRDRAQNFTGGDFFKPLLNLAALDVTQQITETARLKLNVFGRTLDAEQFNVNLLGENARSFTHTTSIGGTLQLDRDDPLFGRANRLTAGVEYVHHAVGVTVFDESRDTGERSLNSKLAQATGCQPFAQSDGLARLQDRHGIARATVGDQQLDRVCADVDDGKVSVQLSLLADMA